MANSHLEMKPVKSVDNSNGKKDSQQKIDFVCYRYDTEILQYSISKQNISNIDLKDAS